MIIKTTIRLTYNNNFIETSALKDGSQAINAINAINPFDSSGNVSADQATAAINPVAIPDTDTDHVSDDQATAAINPVVIPDTDTDHVSDDQLKNEGQQNFQDGTGAYVHVDQTFDKVGLIKGYTRTIAFPSVIFKPTNPKNIKQIKLN